MTSLSVSVFFATRRDKGEALLFKQALIYSRQRLKLFDRTFGVLFHLSNGSDVRFLKKKKISRDVVCPVLPVARTYRSRSLLRHFYPGNNCDTVLETLPYVRPNMHQSCLPKKIPRLIPAKDFSFPSVYTRD